MRQRNRKRQLAPITNPKLGTLPEEKESQKPARFLTSCLTVPGPGKHPMGRPCQGSRALGTKGEAMHGRGPDVSLGAFGQGRLWCVIVLVPLHPL